MMARITWLQKRERFKHARWLCWLSRPDHPTGPMPRLAAASPQVSSRVSLQLQQGLSTGIAAAVGHDCTAPPPQGRPATGRQKLKAAGFMGLFMVAVVVMVWEATIMPRSVPAEQIPVVNPCCSCELIMIPMENPYCSCRLTCRSTGRSSRTSPRRTARS